MDANDDKKSSKIKTQKGKVVVIGAGVCGMYAAIDLLRKGFDVIIIEKRSLPGGLAAGVKRGDNYYDFGVHMLHAHDKEIFEDIKKIMGDERIEVNLDARIRWQGKFYRYPLQFVDLIIGMNKLILTRCVIGLFASQIRYKISPKTPQNALEALYQLYGKSLTKFFFQEFTERYWGIPTEKLSATFITTKMPRLTAVDVIKKVFSYLGIQNKSSMAVDSALNEEILHYSENGAEAMPRLLAAEIARLGGKIKLGEELTEARLQKIDENYRVKKIISIDKKGKKHEYACDNCLSTIPLNYLANAFSPKPKQGISEAANKLRNKAIAIYGILVKKNKAIDGLYIYYRRHIFHRICEPKNAGMNVKPPGHTVLIAEMTCDVNDAKWNGEQKVIDQLITELEEENILTKSEVVETHVLTYAHGYPLYDLGFEKNLDFVQSAIKKIVNLQSVGRQGAFCFPGMHKAMRQGKDAAQNIISQKRDKSSS